MMKQLGLLLTAMLLVSICLPVQAALQDDEGLRVGIVSVEINSELKPVVTYILTDGSGNPLSPLTDVSTIRFILTHLVQDNPDYLSHYESYTSTASNGQATYDSGGKQESLGGDRWRYTFAKAIPSSFDMTATHLLSGQISRSAGELTFHANPVFYFVPNGSPVTQKRELSSTETCNKCHNGLGLHGGGRREYVLCLTCHNPQSIDPESGNSVDMKVMIHKIHRGANLPSVVAGTPYQIIGRNNAISDYSEIHYPQDIRNCDSCHTGEQGDSWKTAPSRAACGSCHDNINFATGVGHAKMTNDNLCALCHTPEGGDYSIVDTHIIPNKAPSLRGIVSEITDVKNAGPSQAIEVYFTLKNADDQSVINIASMSRVALTFGGPTTDYKSFLTETVTAAAATLTDGVYKYSFTAPLPANAAGSFAVALEARRSVTVGSTTFNESVYNPIKYFSVDGSTVAARRQVVSSAECDTCHNGLELHGSLRKNLDYCVFCHSPNTTDISRRPAEAMPPTTVNFKEMIHRIHTGHELEYEYTVYGFGSTPHNYNEIGFPGDRKQCGICHKGNSYQIPLPSSVIPTTITQGESVISTTPPIQAACLSCHSSGAAIAHAQLNTTPNGSESCGVCHAPGRIAALNEAHAQTVFLTEQIPVEPGTAILNWMLDR